MATDAGNVTVKIGADTSELEGAIVRLNGGLDDLLPKLRELDTLLERRRVYADAVPGLRRAGDG